MKIGIASTDWSRSLFDSHGMNIPGGANWVRLQQMRRHLGHQSAAGWLVWQDELGFGVSNGNDKFVFDFDVLIMQRIMFKSLADQLEQYREKSSRAYIINDVDDWYWGLDPRNAAYSLTRPENNPNENIDHYRRVIELSDMVTVSTPFLKKCIEDMFGHKNVHLIENCVTVADFSQRRFTGKQPIVGWVGSTNHRSGDLEELYGIFNNSFKFHHSGHYGSENTFAKALGVKPSRVSKSPMRPPLEYAKMSFCFDIGLAPLSDIEFNYAKSWIKLLEYSASGIPFVASPRPEYVRLVERLGAGRIAYEPVDWIRHVAELQDHETRIQEGLLLKERVTELLDVTVMADRWLGVVSSAL